jgi:hypothetical protein
VDNYSRAYLWLISHDLSHGVPLMFIVDTLSHRCNHGVKSVVWRSDAIPQVGLDGATLDSLDLSTAYFASSLPSFWWNLTPIWCTFRCKWPLTFAVVAFSAGRVQRLQIRILEKAILGLDSRQEVSSHWRVQAEIMRQNRNTHERTVYRGNYVFKYVFTPDSDNILDHEVQ